MNLRQEKLKNGGKQLMRQMSPGGGWDDAVAANKEKGFFNHSANAVTKTGPVYCFWEVKEGISAEDFQEFRWTLWSRVWTRCIDEYL